MKTVIAALLLVGSGVALAASPFDGTWKMRADSAKATGKPDTWAIVDGMYQCPSCVPAVKVKADGHDQKVSGHAYYDTIAVTVVNPTTVEMTQKRAGKQVGNVTYVVSSDGHTLTGKFNDYNGAKVASGTFTETRHAPGPAGAHAVSGSWMLDQVVNVNDAGTIVSYQMTDEQFSSQFNGQSYSAKFDGKDYPVHNDPGNTVVSLRKVDASTVIETDKRDGKLTDEIRMAAAADGKTIAVTDKDLQHDQVTTFTLEKQP
jgi:hypothetical protein